MKHFRLGWVFGLFSAFFLQAAPSYAHPHVWADMRSQLVVSDTGLISGVRVQWTTDKVYAKDALDGFTVKPDGTYDAADLAKLTAENLDALSGYGYFIFFRMGGEVQKIGKPVDGLQTYNAKDGRLTLLFTMPLETPLDPHAGSVTLKVYDPEFFIDFEYVADKPLLISKPLAQGCKAELKSVNTNAALNQTKQMLSTKDKTWKPDNNEDFGGLFAQPIEVKCG